MKPLEFADGGVTLTALAILLAKDNGRGLGDMYVAKPYTPLDKWQKADRGLKRVQTPTRAHCGLMRWKPDHHCL
jgi:hypothetical protein